MKTVSRRDRAGIPLSLAFSRATALLALLVVSIGLVACDGSAEPNDGSSASLVVGFSQIGAESDWRRANTQSIRDEAHRFAQHYHHMLRSRSLFEDGSGRAD